MKTYNKNGLDIIIKNNEKTPRIAICCHFLIEKAEKYSGVYSLFTKLLMQGTTTKNSTELALLLENNGIEMGIKCKQDYFCVSSLCLNEDYNLTLEIMADILSNSTFEEFEKEVHKLKGEIKSELDHPRIKATDSFIKEIFNEHYYSNSHTKTLMEIDKITKEDVVEVLGQIMNAKKAITIVGDVINPEQLADEIAQKFAFLNNTTGVDLINKITPIAENKLIKIAKGDVQQAQIIQGWHGVNFTDEDYPKIIVMNNILGSSGLSSRLFVELRDKKGLAYTVRSSFEALVRGAILYFYIATDPKNIKASLNGFEIEIQKLQNTPVDEIELQGGKENVLGRLEYFSQTNNQQASTFGYDWIMGLGLQYEEKYRKMINKVSALDIQHVAQKYFSKPSVTVVLAPSENLNF